LGKIVHGALDVGGLVPVIGEPADLRKRRNPALEGDELNRYWTERAWGFGVFGGPSFSSRLDP
jgi:hypothetical protein